MCWKFVDCFVSLSHHCRDVAIYRENFYEVLLTALITIQAHNNVLMARVSPWGSWDWDRGLRILAVDKWELRKDLGGVMFRASSAHDPPYVAVVRDMDLDNLPRGYKARPGHWQYC